MAGQEFRQMLLVNGNVAALEHGGLAGVIVHGDDFVAHVGETGGSHQPYVTRTDYRNLHAMLRQ